MLRLQDRSFDLFNALDATRAALGFMRLDSPRRAEALDRIALTLESSRTDILDVAAAETALLPAELSPEFDRMTGTLRMFEALLREGSWVRAAISPRAANSIGPNHDVRSMLFPLGPVAVFGASNFPLAYGVCGGDTASALAAGCPVLVKEHPAHPKTGRLMFKLAQDGLRAAGVGEHALSYAAHADPADLSIPNAIVGADLIRAVGFTGSRRAGLAIQSLADRRPTPIPVFAEMGSANPVVITPAALRARGPEIARQLSDSLLARFGQQCTCPGIIIAPDAVRSGEAFLEALARSIDSAAPRDMLAPWIRDGYIERVREAVAVPEVRLIAGSADPLPARSARAAMLLTSADRFAWHSELRDEIFGPALLVVDTPPESITSLPLPASLTLSLFFEPDELDLAHQVLASCAHTTGRIIFNGVPTGVRVAEGMVHGGPFPATNRPDTTAVGPRAIERWCRPVCWQNAPQDLLPDELKDSHPPHVRGIVNNKLD